MISSRFTQQLQQFKITLDADVLEYIDQVLNDITDPEEIREVTETYLHDANINDKARNDFYKALFSNVETTKPTKKDDGPVLLKKVQEEKSTPTSAPVSEQQTEAPKRTKRLGKREKGQAKKSNQDQEPTIVAISQQSRFHTETLETLSKDIDLHGVQISVNNLDLLVDAHLKLKACVRYGLVGQNGVGKSILMRSMADNILVGLPQNLNILHIAQLEDFEETVTALQEILNADKKATITIREYEALHTVIGDSKANVKASKDLNKVVFSIMASRIKDRLEDADRLATKRSGLRGKEARKELVKVEKEYKEFCELDPQTYVTNDMVNTIITEVFEQYGFIDQEERTSRARKLLLGLGFSNEQQTNLISTFSGGWRMRIALAKSLFMKPDVLLLDEPTNHLDLPAILWLQEYLLNETDGMTLVIVSHDREFLNNVTEETIILKDKQFKYHAGNFEDWVNNTEEQRIRKQALLDNVEKKRKKIQDSIQHNIQTAKSTGDDKRHGMINSRRKKLERLGMEKTEDGKRFKQSYRAGFHATMREEIVVEQGFKTSAIKIPEPSELRYNGPVLRLTDASFKYPGQKTNTIEPISMNIEVNSRIGIIGANGSGKSTLLNMLTGRTQPTSGEVYHHHALRIGYFSQHIVDQIDLDTTPVEYMMSLHPTLSEQDVRAHFGTIGVSGSVVLQKIRTLSGGQRNRIAFAQLLYEHPHVLVLDEITNHLDMGTVDVLVEALKDYSGTLVIVSHDVWFLKQLFEDEEEDEDEDEFDVKKKEVYTIKQGKVTKWEKGIDKYVAQVLRSVNKKK